MNKTDYKDDEIDLKELLATIWQKRFFVVLITALISLMGGGYAYLHNPTPLYNATLYMEIGEIQNENFGSRSIENTKDLATILNIELGVNARLKSGSTKVLEIIATSADKNALTPTLEKAKAFVLDRHTKLAEFYKAKIMTKELGSIAISDQINRPKKKLIVAVSLVTGFVLSIFLVFFIEFIRGFRADQN